MLRESVPAKATQISLRTAMLTAAAMVCFAANSLLCRLALAQRRVDAATFTSLRVTSAAAMLIIVVWLQRRGLPRLDRANSFSIVSLFAYFILFSFAYLRLDAASGA